MAARLIAAGYQLTVWNRTPAAMDSLLAQGATAARTPREAASSAEIIISMLTDDDAARTVWLIPGREPLPVSRKALWPSSSSTVTPAWISELKGAVSRYEARLIDAPVAGSRPQAEAGQLIFIVGGERADVERAEAALKALSNAIHLVGPAGSGALMKLVVNSLFAGQVALAAELSRLLARAGIDPARAVEVMSAVPVTSSAALGAFRMIAAGNHAPLFPIDLVTKDLGYALAAADAAAVSLPTTSAILDLFKSAQTSGFGGDNITGVARLFP